MVRNKEKIEQESSYSNALEDVLSNIDIDITNISDVDDLKPPNKNTYMHFEKVKEESSKKAEEMVDSIIKFYLDKSMYSTEEGKVYLQNKRDIDVLTVSNLIFQMRTAEYAITKLLEEIDNGNIHPRQFEVLASLQKSKMEIVKYLSIINIQLENNYKIIRQEYNSIYQNDSDDDALIGGIGTKGLLRQIKDQVDNKKEDEVIFDFKDEDVND